MEPEKLLEVLHTAEKLKCTLRHCDTSTGRRESVAEHSWRISLMAMLLTDEFPDLNIDRVIRMCLIHDMGEAFTGDIPCFMKTDTDEEREERLLTAFVNALPQRERKEWSALYAEMEALATPEAKLYKALDQLEAVIQHDEADISTWLESEYALQLSHGKDKVTWSPYLNKLKAAIDRETMDKIKSESPEQLSHIE